MIDWLAGRWNAFVDFLWQLVLSVFDMLKDLFFWVLEQLFNVGLLILDGMGSMLTGLDVASYWSEIPPETAYILTATGFSQAIGVIITALMIRFTLQMIPFVRWGS